MRKYKNRKLLAVVAAASVALAGCGSGTGTDTDISKAQPEEESQTEDSAMQEAKEKQEVNTETEVSGDNTLVVAIQANSFITDYDDNYLTHYLEDKLGIEIEFSLLPTASDEVATKVSLMAASGDELPDVLLVDNAISTESILQYGSNGIFLPLNEYMADPSVMPNYNNIPDEDKAVMEAAQLMADGNMYSFSKFEPSTWNMTPNRMFINKAWLDKLGLSIPSTTDELKDVLIAFRDQDPNGNGIQDEIGVYGMQSGGYGQNVTASLMNSFVFWNGGGANGGLALDDTGNKVVAPFVTQEWKDGLAYMNDLYQEGLLSPAIFTDDDTQFKATLNNETNIVGFVSMGSLGNYPDAATNPNFQEMELIEPLAGPEGLRYTPYMENSPQQEMFIFSSSDKVDLAIRFADEFFDPYTSIVVRDGEEGVDWTSDPEVLKDMTNGYVEAGLYDEVQMAVYGDIWASNNAQTWHNINPRYSDLNKNNTTAECTKEEYDPEDTSQIPVKSMLYYYDKHPEHILAPLHYTVDEVSEIQDALVNIPSYVNQTMAEFITGAKNLESDWDAYLKELNNMGLEQWLIYAQDAYERLE